MIPISERALAARISRRLARDGETLHRTRGDRWRGELGAWYVADAGRFVVAKHCDLEALGRETGALQAGEALA
jgi:hypothetical protein